MIPLPKKIDEQSVQSKLTQETSNVNTKYSSENHLFSNFRKQSAKITKLEENEQQIDGNTRPLTTIILMGTKVYRQTSK